MAVLLKEVLIKFSTNGINYNPPALPEAMTKEGGLIMKATRWKVSMGCFGLLLMISVMMFGCGGGGGDDGGGGGGDTPAPDVPEILNYAVSGQWYTTPDLLRGVLSGGPGMTFMINSIALQGTYNRETEATTLQNNAGMNFTVSPNPYGGGTLTLGLLIPGGTTVRWVGSADPTEGDFQLNISASPYDFDRIMVKVNANAGGTGIAGVDIEAFDGPDSVLSASLSWAAFDAVTDDEGAPTYQRVARLGYSAWQFVYRYISLAYTGLAGMVTNDTDIQSSSSKSITLDGDTFSAAGPATLKITWIDDGNGELGPNDDFDNLFTEWWVDTPGDIDFLYNGLLKLTGYTETSAPNNSIGGDFTFSSLTEVETENGAILQGDTWTINGGFNLTYTW